MQKTFLTPLAPGEEAFPGPEIHCGTTALMGFGCGSATLTQYPTLPRVLFTTGEHLWLLHHPGEPKAALCLLCHSFRMSGQTDRPTET